MNLHQRIREASICTPTPFYFYDMELLESTLKVLNQVSTYYGYKVHYAMKANSNDEILKLIHSYNFGLDCVSGNELQKGLKIGFNSNEIAFAGVGKTDKEINLALSKNIFSINCESMEEIEVVNLLAKEHGKIANIAVRINPNIDAKTHKNITTGKKENKFGINASNFDELLNFIPTQSNIRLAGLHFHIGSQILDYSPFIELCKIANTLIQITIERGFNITHINLGGGIGINYYEPNSNSIPDFKNFFKTIYTNLKIPKAIEVHFELGRSVVGNCGNLITQVLYNKKGESKNFLIVDAGMTELMRPALYDAYHKIEGLENSLQTEKYDVVGPICESTDTFASNIELPKSKRGDILVIKSTGAYAESMSLNYNLRDKAKSVYDYGLDMLKVSVNAKSKHSLVG